MSLKIEQRLDNHTFMENQPRIYTTGAYLVPMRVVVDGEPRYVWVVDEFEDDTYNDEGVCVSMNVYATDISKLFQEE